jgi:hypothetical protein
MDWSGSIVEKILENREVGTALRVSFGVSRPDGIFGKDSYEPLNIDERISIGTAIDAYTINAAFAMKQDATTGSLEVGKGADFVILDRDILSVDSKTIEDTGVLATYLDGCLVYSAMLGALRHERDSCIRERLRHY